MPVSLDDFHISLINKILFASSQQQVKLLIDAAVKSLEENNISDNAILSFIKNSLNDLELFNPMDKDAQQWSNIKIARIQFYRCKRRYGSILS